jgi:hypothetical protein
MNEKQFFNFISVFLIGVGLFDTSFLIGCEGKGRIHSSNEGKNNNGETNKSAALFDTFIYNLNF